jgi:aerobic-type carbon monoxide dehydrogenase small subunit (CoxS/CutS family)
VSERFAEGSRDSSARHATSESPTTLLAETPDPTDSDIDTAMAGQLCRCGTYPRIRQAIHRLAKS